MIIVVPVSLVQQYKDEIRRYTQFAHVDVVPYLGNLDTRRNFWTAAWKASRQPNIRKILLATTTVRPKHSKLTGNTQVSIRPWKMTRRIYGRS